MKYTTNLFYIIVIYFSFPSSSYSFKQYSRIYPLSLIQKQINQTLSLHLAAEIPITKIDLAGLLKTNSIFLSEKEILNAQECTTMHCINNTLKKMIFSPKASQVTHSVLSIANLQSLPLSANSVISGTSSPTIKQFIIKEKFSFIIIGISLAILFFLLFSIFFLRKYFFHQKKKKILCSDKTQKELSKFPSTHIEESSQENNDKWEKIKLLEKEIINSTNKLGNVCKHNFIRTHEYKELKIRIQNEEKLDNKKREKYRNIIFITFHPYNQSLSANFHLTRGECFLCCLTILGFTINECSQIIGNTVSATRTQKSRIKTKLCKKNTKENLYTLIFHSSNSIPTKSKQFLIKNREYYRKKE